MILLPQKTTVETLQKPQSQIIYKSSARLFLYNVVPTKKHHNSLPPSHSLINYLAFT